MAIKHITSHSEMLESLKGEKRSYILLYKKGSEQSECAVENVSNAAATHGEINILAADVSQVRDIHDKYNIKTVPVILVFEDDNFRNVIKGCQNTGYVNSLFENAVFIARKDENGTPQKNVTVYSTPTCSWCNTLKAHLRKHGIYYTDIDVSADPSLAEELVRKSGQQGVPQTEIDGEIIVGFDKARINRLLGIDG